MQRLDLDVDVFSMNSELFSLCLATCLDTCQLLSAETD